MKKIIFILTSLFILSACGSDTSDSALKNFEGNGFTLDVPKAWVKVEENELPSTKNGKIELALTSSEINEGFVNNMVIISEDIVKETTSVKYAITNYVRSTGEMNDFLKLNEIDFKFTDGDEGKIYTFEAKYSNETPKRKFLQTAKICGNKAYLTTIGINLDNDSTSKYENLLKSFNCSESK